MNKIMTFKLVSGEEIIAKVVDETEYTYIVSSPRTLSLHQTQDGRVSAGFVPSLILGNDEELYLAKSAIVMYNTNVQKEYEDRYLEVVSGLTLASSLKG